MPGKSAAATVAQLKAGLHRRSAHRFGLWHSCQHSLCDIFVNGAGRFLDRWGKTAVRLG
jgi:hypothetical protein